MFRHRKCQISGWAGRFEKNLGRLTGPESALWWEKDIAPALPDFRSMRSGPAGYSQASCRWRCWWQGQHFHRAGQLPRLALDGCKVSGCLARPMPLPDALADPSGTPAGQPGASGWFARLGNLGLSPVLSTSGKEWNPRTLFYWSRSIIFKRDIYADRFGLSYYPYPECKIEAMQPCQHPE